MNKTFYINENTKCELSYDDLFHFLSSSTTVITNYKDNNTGYFFMNLVKAICYDVDVILLDTDFTDKEINELLGSEYIKNEVEIKDRQISSVVDLIDIFKTSKASITIFTSGTTGQPKKVIHSIHTLIREVRIGEKFIDNVWGFAYNPTHMAGLQVFFQALLNQNTLIDIFSKKREEVNSAIEKYKITHISATPTFYRLLLPVDQQFNSVKRISLGGEKSSEQLYNQVKAIFPNAKISNIYASTEAGTLLASKGEGFVIPDSKRKLIKIVHNELLLHEELLGKSNSLSIVEGWYYSGDIIEWIDEYNGHFKFANRKNEMINVGGFKVNPNEVEDTIRIIFDIKQVVVYGKPNSVLGNIICCDIVADQSSLLTEIVIKQELLKHLQPFKVPRKINFVHQIELSRTGKIKR